MSASLPKIFEARPIRLSISGMERLDEWISLPRYVKIMCIQNFWYDRLRAGVKWVKFPHFLYYLRMYIFDLFINFYHALSGE